jgi:hypothetical protein
MAGKPKPWWLQIHLSTYVILMFVLAGLLVLNVLNQKDLGLCGDSNVFARTGWPFVLYERGCFPGSTGGSYVLAERDGGLVQIVGNLLVSASSLFAVAFACEWSIRRWERKP